MGTQLWVALDVPTLGDATRIAELLEGSVDAFKVGLQLFVSAGPAAVRMLKKKGFDVFLDLKYHDIPNTVSNAVRSATRLRVDYIDVHLSGGTDMVKAAVEAAKTEAVKIGLRRAPKILGISVLTSLDDKALEETLASRLSASELVVHLAKVARSCRVSGIVTSIHEVSMIRECCSGDLFIVTPGIRATADAERHDQRRVGTAADAARLGVSAIVVGRSILRAEDPVEAATRFRAELRGATP